MIPIFCQAFINGKAPTINGDGKTSRDFTYIDNVVLANDLALFTHNPSAFNQVYNTACGDQVTLNEIIKMLHRRSAGKILNLNTALKDGVT